MSGTLEPEVILIGKIAPEVSLSGTITPTVSLQGKVSVPTTISGVDYPATTERLGLIKVGDNLSITEEGVLSVDVANEAEEDNTKPITSAAVNTMVGNINAFLATI